MAEDPILVGEGDIDAARTLVDLTGQAELFPQPVTSTTTSTGAHADASLEIVSLQTRSQSIGSVIGGPGWGE